ncbi:phosphate ABC transporter substrate-binding protein PstS [Telmatocola sphagniphila]|uniref:Phosphate-binding protein n=1 Tax=Telmatocola sphagniphila TaxID=1123043 RepID=A0A8E6B719_9BACT|nr:phosphate ABC transporter substrate-binding protein PstS [Telmatocola sphagniphila]QVL32552.1 phosphate ABC transporter substrate-binding protein PstS [Telmatocola sphagniphila]
MRFFWIFLLLLTTLTGCKDARRINAGGASFIYPAMLVWSREYEKLTGVQIDYQSTGSGNGVQQTLAQTINFGCTDAFIKDDLLEKAKQGRGEILHIPLAMGAVVPIYNLPEVNQPLNFTGTLLAEIFMGKVTHWNDPAIKEINPGLELPDREIVPVTRSDSSGTTSIFTDYLSKVSAEWKTKIKSGTTVNWPKGVGQRGNEGVAGHVFRSPYAIGYVELIFAVQNKVSYGKVESRDSTEKNAAHVAKTGLNSNIKERVFLLASLESVSAAADAAFVKIPADLRYSLTNISGPNSYPISGTNWAVLYKSQPEKLAEDIKKFLLWVTEYQGEGQKRVRELGYSPLPERLCNLIKLKLESITIVENSR